MMLRVFLILIFASPEHGIESVAYEIKGEKYPMTICEEMQESVARVHGARVKETLCLSKLVEKPTIPDHSHCDPAAPYCILKQGGKNK